MSQTLKDKMHQLSHLMLKAEELAGDIWSDGFCPDEFSDVKWDIEAVVSDVQTILDDHFEDLTGQNDLLKGEDDE